ncbi:putative gustatory receptor 28b, partial [Schistocerca piceifrons]|uniref:putative gustatory receptor 28b n=1 Tax=Schistocerca piceifrons TaxID=274613 RepID=UPI001F5E8B65
TSGLMVTKNSKSLGVVCFSMFTEDDLNVRLTEALQSSSVKETSQHYTHVITKQVHQHEMSTLPDVEKLSIRSQQNTSNHAQMLLTRNSCTFLRKLRTVYCLLHQAVIMINRAYGVQNLFIITTCLVCIVVNMHAVTVTLLRLNNALHGDLRIYTVVRISLWTGMMVWRIVGICYSSEVVTREASRTQHLVTKLQMLPFPAGSGVQEELQLFAEQLTHSPIHYSATGFFTLDVPLLKSIAAAVTTYLVILIQFSLSDTNK